MSIRTCAIGILAAAALTACGNDDDHSPLAELGGSLVAQMRTKASVPSTVDDLALRALSRYQKPVMVGGLEARDSRAILLIYGTNGVVTTWTTSDYQTVAMRGNRVIATRGLGADLMAVSEIGMRRTYHLMDAANGDVQVTVDCAPRIAGPEVITLAGGEVVRTTRVDETCSGPDAQFVNQYWAGTDGGLRRSRQWIGPQSGYLELQRLR